jgi:hypothetical protein
MHRRTFVAIHVERKMQLLAMSEPKLIKRGREHRASWVRSEQCLALSIGE